MLICNNHTYECVVHEKTKETEKKHIKRKKISE